MNDDEAAIKAKKDYQEEKRWKDIYQRMAEKEIMEKNPHTWKQILFTNKRYQSTREELETFG